MTQGAATPMEATSPKNGIFLKNESFMVLLRVIITFFERVISLGKQVCHYDFIEIYEGCLEGFKGLPVPPYIWSKAVDWRLILGKSQKNKGFGLFKGLGGSILMNLAA